MSFRHTALVLLLLLGSALALVAAGCGGEGDKDKESEGAKAPCKAAALTTPTGLPAAFPAPGELTFTKAQKDGPTVLVDGYWTADLDKAYKDYKDQVEKAGYTITHDEKDEHDAEINYTGSGKAGQIALKDNCTESDTTRVHITNRPE